MRIGAVDFPEPLLTSQRDRKLVVFAGSGVSMPSPSNYPDFPGLATRIASDVLKRGDNEPIDRFLGSLHDKGMRVHDLVSAILTDPQSKPNSLHIDLLRLFESPETLRLVTTNFDRHFTDAAASVFGSGEPCEIYNAPALPLGDSFNGIVYLHGSVEKPPDRLVLTDRDFGRAYLTEGWARIFLQKLFSHYSVLFVGYSHDDVVMNYLARGLPPEVGAPQRFSLTPIGNEERWIRLGITPIIYKLTDETNKHSALSASIDAWAIQTRQGALDREQRIRTIVELLPPLDLEDVDYIEASLRQVYTTRFFTRYADGVEWLKWVEDRKFLKRLFQVDSSLSEVDWELAQWFANKFVLKHEGEALSLIRRQGQHVHPLFWKVIAQRLFRKEQEQGVGYTALRRWLPTLINLWLPRSGTEQLDFLLGRISDSEDVVTAIVLFEFMARPVVRLEKDLWGEIKETKTGEDVTADITTLGDEYWLQHFSKQFVGPHLAIVIDALEPIVTSHLQEAYFLLRAFGQADDRSDYLSRSRGQIEDSSQGGTHNGLGVLIDIAYQLIKWNNSKRPTRSDALISQWFSSPSQVLRRLAIIGVAESSHWTPDQKLSWLLSENLLYMYGTKHEVFEVLKAAYASSSEPSKKAILEQVQRGRVPGFDIPENIMVYERYNLLNWLQAAAPDSLITRREFDAMQEAYPHFGKRTRPDLDVEIDPAVWTTVGSRSPVTADSLLAKPPAEQIDWLVSFEPQHLLGADRYGLIESVREAAARNFEWGMGLARGLAARSLRDSDLWAGIVRAWDSSLSISQWKEAFSFLAENQNIFPVSQREIAALLSEGTKGDSPSIPNDALDLAMVISKQLWLVCAKDTDPRKGSFDRDWLSIAINHPAGMLALFWLNLLSKRRKDSGDRWTGLPGETKQFFEDIVYSDSFAADLVRVVFASQLTFFFALDEAWAKKHVLPLFDWSIRDSQAVQAFQGFLVWGRQTEALLPHLLPLYVKVFSHMAALGKSRDRFCEYLAGAACHSSINPLKDGWVNQFLVKSELRDRTAFARWIRQILRGMHDEARKALWDIWIGEYWRNRLRGVPILLDAAELAEMVEWILFLGPAFPDVVDLLRESPAFQLENSFIYRELDESKIPEAYPSKTAELLVVLLKNEDAVLFDLDRVDAVVRRIVADAPLPELFAICDDLARLGFVGAAALRQFVQNQS
jgi:SIR2-like domain/Domain of unknown function (DUF4020)